MAFIEENLCKTYNLNLSVRKHKLLIEVLQAQCLATKNLTNTALFVIKNIQSSYYPENETGIYELKENLHENQSDILDFVNTHIPYFQSYKASLRAKRELSSTEAENVVGLSLQNNYSADNIENSQSTEVKTENLTPKLSVDYYTNEINKDIYYQILDKTFLQFVVELYSKHQATIYNQKNNANISSDHEICLSSMRRQAIHGLVDNYQTFFKSLNDYVKNPSKYKARPQPPSYLTKRSGQTFEVPGPSIPASGKLVKIKPGVELFTDYDKTTLLTVEQLEAYKEFSLTELLTQVKTRHKIDKEHKPVLMRIVPKGIRIKIEVVFDTVIKTPINSVLGQLITLAKDSDLYKEKTNNILEIKNKNLISVFQDKFLKNNDINTLQMASIDLGITNIAGIAYNTTTAHKGKIISNKVYEKHIKQYDTKIDNLKRSLSNKAVDKITIKNLANKEQKQILKEKLKEFDIKYKGSALAEKELEVLKQEVIKSVPIVKLTKKEIEFLRVYQKSIYENLKYKDLVRQKNNFVQDCLHKLSHELVQDFKNKNIELVVVGKNDNWKQNSNIGRTQNRRFYNIPHSRLIQMLRYKCYGAGILLLTTEESYTSKTSFINGSTLKTFDNNADRKYSTKLNKKEKQEIKTQTYGGTRDSKNRHMYTNTSRDLLNHKDNGPIKNPDTQSGKKEIIIHAELNGAYNMPRKLTENFKYNKSKHSIKYDIYTMFGRKTGLSKLGNSKVKFAEWLDKPQVMPAIASQANVLAFDLVSPSTA